MISEHTIFHIGIALSWICMWVFFIGINKTKDKICAIGLTIGIILATPTVINTIKEYGTHTKENTKIEMAKTNPESISKNFSLIKSGNMKEKGKTIKISIYESENKYIVIEENTENSINNSPKIKIYDKNPEDKTVKNLLKQL